MFRREGRELERLTFVIKEKDRSAKRGQQYRNVCDLRDLICDGIEGTNRSARNGVVMRAVMGGSELKSEE